MAEGQRSRAEGNLAKFIEQMSEATGLVEEYNENPERVMSEAGLSEEEMAMVLRGDEDEIIAALGGDLSHSTPLTIRPPRIRFRRRRPPPKPTTAS